MFEYLYDAKYKKAKKNYNNAKSKINKLKKYKSDITDDKSSITQINKKIDDINSYISNAILDSYVSSKIGSRLYNLKEQNQESDADLSNADRYLSYEIDLVQKEIDASESTMVAIKNQY